MKLAAHLMRCELLSHQHEPNAPALHWCAMTTVHVFTLFALLTPTCDLVAGWGDPCETNDQGEHTNASWAGLSSEQQAACTECGAVECDGESGEDDDVADGKVTCALGGGDYSEGYCFAGEWASGMIGEQANEIEVMDASECRTLSTNTYDCYRSWYDASPPNVGPSECVMCDVFVAADYDIGGQWEQDWGPLTPHDVTFALCDKGLLLDNPPTTGSAWDAFNQQPEDALALEDTWWLPLGCMEGDWLTPFSCEVVQIREIQDHPSYPSNKARRNWTCACETDADCQPGAACEAGYHIDDQGHSVPSLCRPFDEVGNSTVPGGPPAYNMGSWSEGITLRGTDVTVTPAFAVAATVGMAGLWNDDQTFDRSTGELKRCGDESLCTWLGLGEGDRVGVDTLDLARLVFGAPVPVTIEHEDGTVEAWTLSVQEAL